MIDIKNLGGSVTSIRLINIIQSLNNPDKTLKKVYAIYNDFCTAINILNKSNDLNYKKFIKVCLLSELSKRIYEKSFLRSVKDVYIRRDIQQRLFSIIKYRITH